ALANTLTSDLFNGEERMRMVTRVTVVQYFGIASVPLVISGLLMLGSWRLSFALAASLGFFALIFCLPIKLAYTSATASIQTFRKHLRELLFSRRVISLLTLRATSALILFGIVYVHFPLLFTERLPDATHLVGPIYSFYAVGMLVGSLLTTHVTCRFGATTPGYLGGSSLTLGLALLVLLSAPWMGAIAMAMVGIGTALINSSTVGHISLATTPDTRGSIMSAYSTVFRAGQTVAPILCGMYFQMVGASWLFATGTILAIVLTLWATATFRYANAMEHQSAPH
ncbi:MAG: MFS transporter, partial [Mailhella sp.]|nr:MFS transporter [Mailhella sp.]